MENIPVMFYDGQSSAGRKALLSLMPDFWEIRYTGADFQSYSVKWDVNQLSRVDTANGMQLFRYGSFPHQVIECVGIDLISYVKRQYPHAKIFNSDPFMLKGRNQILIASLVLIALLATVYFWVLPASAAFVASKIPQKIETDLGGSMLKSFIAGSEKDEKLSTLVNRFAKEIDFKTFYPIEITVVNNEVVNAFALPGGKIVVYDAILKKMKRPEELAALLAHEVAHIEYKHSLNSISRSLSHYIFISLIFNDINGISTVLIDNANTLNNLSYSRSLETDADYRALTILELNQISQLGMVGLFEMLNSKQDFSYLKFLSTHPLTAERIAYAKKIAGKQKSINTRKEISLIWAEINEELAAKERH